MEFVHLESGTLAINYICTKRRLMYLHHILNVPEHELIHRVYSAQKESPVKGDWVLMAGKDMEHINLNMEEKHIQSMSKSEYKKIIEEKVTETAFNEYNRLKSSKSKTKDVQHSKLKMQPYMKSVDFNNKEVKTLFNLRAKTVWNYRGCFKSMYKNNMACSCRSLGTAYQGLVLVRCTPQGEEGQCRRGRGVLSTFLLLLVNYIIN